jgi:hypothetical protein
MEEDSRSTTRIGSNHSRPTTIDHSSQRSSRLGRVLQEEEDDDERKPPAIVRLHQHHQFNQHQYSSVPTIDHSQLPPKPPNTTYTHHPSPPKYTAKNTATSTTNRSSNSNSNNNNNNNTKAGTIQDPSTHTESTRTNSSRRSVRKVEDDEVSLYSHPVSPPPRAFSYLSPTTTTTIATTGMEPPSPAPQQSRQGPQYDTPQVPYASAGRITPVPPMSTHSDDQSMDLQELQRYTPQRKTTTTTTTTGPEPQRMTTTTTNNTNMVIQYDNPHDPFPPPPPHHHHHHRPLLSSVVDRDTESSSTTKASSSSTTTRSNISSVGTEELLVAKIYAANGGNSSGFLRQPQQQYPQHPYQRIHQSTKLHATDEVANTTLKVGKGVMLSNEANDMLLDEKKRQRQERQSSSDNTALMKQSRLGPHPTLFSFSRRSESFLSETTNGADSHTTTTPDPPSLVQRQPHYVRPGAFRMTSDGYVEPPQSNAQEDIETPTSTPLSSIVRDYSRTPTEAPDTTRGGSGGGGRQQQPMLRTAPSLLRVAGEYLVEASLVANPRRSPRTNPPRQHTTTTTATTTTAGGEQFSSSPSCYSGGGGGVPPPPGQAQYMISLGETTTGTSVSVASSPVVEAHRVDENHAIRMFFQNRKVQFGLSLVTALFVVLVVGTVVGVTGLGREKPLTFPSGGGDSSSSLWGEKETIPTTVPPTSAPTVPGDLDLSYFVRMALPSYTQESLQQSDSAQSLALQWLRENNTLLETYSLDRRLQRFALATFFYSTRGPKRWFNKAGWLTDAHECDWYQGVVGVGATSLPEGGGGANESMILMPSNTSNNNNNNNNTNSNNNDIDESELRMACNDKKEYVRLSLPQGGLRGTFPAEMSLLSSLMFLDVPGNIITGSLPSTMGKLTRLQELQLCTCITTENCFSYVC